MILDAKGNPVTFSDQQVAKRASVRHAIRAKFDVADTTDENYRHWAMADGLSADSAASPGVRTKLRNRSRYEVSNNSYARGIVNTLANDCIGTGPRLQLYGDGVSRTDARIVEGLFYEWMDARGLAEHLRTLRMAKCVDGEGFGIQIDNRNSYGSPVTLDVRLVEAEQVASPSMMLEPNDADGIRFDSYGNPTTYQVLKNHPGSVYHYSPSWESDTSPAARMLHYYTAERPGQRRGIPEITAALPLFAMLRRWTLATVAAAETAADFAAIMYADAPASEDSVQSADAFERIEIERRAMMSLPYGWKMSQMKAEHPTSTYDSTVRALINEIARCLDMPYNVAAANSADYNYASGRLDHQVYNRKIVIDRQRTERQVLLPLFSEWKREAVLLEGYLPQSMRSIRTDWTHRWMWPGYKHVDPVKEANADETRLRSMTTSLSDVYADQGKDWEDSLKQIARERAMMAELGLSVEDVTQGAGEVEEDEEDMPPAKASRRRHLRPTR